MSGYGARLGIALIVVAAVAGPAFAGGIWSAPIVVSPSEGRRPDVVFDPAGNAVFKWEGLHSTPFFRVHSQVAVDANGTAIVVNAMEGRYLRTHCPVGRTAALALFCAAP